MESTIGWMIVSSPSGRQTGQPLRNFERWQLPSQIGGTKRHSLGSGTWDNPGAQPLDINTGLPLLTAIQWIFGTMKSSRMTANIHWKVFIPSISSLKKPSNILSSETRLSHFIYSSTLMALISIHLPILGQPKIDTMTTI